MPANPVQARILSMFENGYIMENLNQCQHDNGRSTHMRVPRKGGETKTC